MLAPPRRSWVDVDGEVGIGVDGDPNFRRAPPTRVGVARGGGVDLTGSAWCNGKSFLLRVNMEPAECCCIAEFLGSAIATPSAIAAAMGAVSWSPHASGILLPSSTIKLVDLSLLSAAEIDWLNNYHSLVWEKVFCFGSFRFHHCWMALLANGFGTTLCLSSMRKFNVFHVNVLCSVLWLPTHSNLSSVLLSQQRSLPMQDIFGSVRRSLVFRGSPENEEASSLGVGGSLVDKISYCIRSSRVFSKPSPPSPPPPSFPKNAAPPIRWRKGELIGCGAFGQVYVGMNLDSGELLAVKQVLIAASNATKEKAQAHIKELEEEVKLLKDLSHPNIVRYLGTVREEDTLNILLEFVPGGSISSLLGKFGAFPEAVIRTYTKQLLLGLEYLHKNGIMHRDIKGANILVDNKGCIKLADFGASKQVVELATISGAKSMKGTPYWMAPEVILQTGHSFSADIWSVGCTVIEMATGKPPWSQQYQQEVAALFHIGTTKSHPPIPDHLSAAAKDFLLKCLQKEPILRSSASELLQHPFVTGEHMNSLPLSSNVTENFEASSPSCAPNDDESFLFRSTVNPLDSGNKQLWGMSNDDDMCVIDDKEDFSQSDAKYKSFMSTNNIESFNPMSDPSDDWGYKFDASPELENRGVSFGTDVSYMPPDQSGDDDKGQKDFSFPGVPSLSEEDDELTESKIKAFLDEKALELKKLQTPLYEEFYNSLNTSCSPNVIESTSEDTACRKYLKLPPKSRSPSWVPISTPSKAVDNSESPGSNGRSSSTVGHVNNHSPQDIPASPLNEWKGLTVDSQQQPSSPSLSFSERQRKWKEELDQELERKREMMRQAGMGGKTSSPKDRALNRQRERTRFASPSK
ncbi:hypothetical protein JHK87_008213 [Glycine soja]|nr:hypothetical protein JHK87_008213 [Glycine soja]